MLKGAGDVGFARLECLVRVGTFKFDEKEGEGVERESARTERLKEFTRAVHTCSVDNWAATKHRSFLAAEIREMKYSRELNFSSESRPRNHHTMTHRGSDRTAKGPQTTWPHF